MDTTPHDRTYTAAELDAAAQIVARQLMAEGVPEADACRAAALAAVRKAAPVSIDRAAERAWEARTESSNR